MTPLINGTNYSAANISVIIPILGVIIGITEINYSMETTIDDNYSLGQDPTSRGIGQNKYTGDITMYKEVWNKIIDFSPQTTPQKLPMFDITITYGGTPGMAFRKETLRGVTFKSNPMSVKAGDTKFLCKIPLAIGGIDF